MQISMMSSSEIEEASIGVPSLFVMVTRHNLLLKTMSVDGTSQSQEAVAEEGMDIIILKFCILSYLHCDVEDPAVSQINMQVTRCYRSSEHNQHSTENSKK